MLPLDHAGSAGRGDQPLSAEERAFVARLPRYQGLVQEAEEVHQRSVHQRKRPAEVAG